MFIPSGAWWARDVVGAFNRRSAGRPQWVECGEFGCGRRHAWWWPRGTAPTCEYREDVAVKQLKDGINAKLGAQWQADVTSIMSRLPASIGDADRDPGVPVAVIPWPRKGGTE